MIESNKAESGGMMGGDSDDEDRVRGERERDRLSLFGGRNDLDYFGDEQDDDVHHDPVPSTSAMSHAQAAQILDEKKNRLKKEVSSKSRKQM